MANEARSPAVETDGLKPAASLTELGGGARRKAALDLGPGSTIVPTAPPHRPTTAPAAPFAMPAEPPIATANFEILPPLAAMPAAEPVLMAVDDMAALERAVKNAETFGRRRPGPLPTAATTLITEEPSIVVPADAAAARPRRGFWRIALLAALTLAAALLLSAGLGQ